METVKVKRERSATSEDDVMLKVKRERSATSEDESKVLLDRISVLPNDVLGFILSFLMLNEAVATSILSRRWKYLWTSTPKLDLNGEALLQKVRKSSLGYVRWVDGVIALHQRPNLEKFRVLFDLNVSLDNERSNYVRWVDGVIALHQRPNLEEFRVLFDLNVSHRECIDKWLGYALSRKVQRLELHLIDIFDQRSCRNYDCCYTFPYKEGNLPDNFKQLRKLSMHLVNVSGEALEFFLGNCPLLEQVSVSFSQVLSSLKIIRPFPSFKCLDIISCHHFESVVIRDSNVVTIKYAGKRINCQLDNVPLLTQLWIGGRIIEHIDDVAEMFSSVLPQLEMFTICCFVHPILWHKGSIKFAMPKLKQLVVRGNFDDELSILPVVNLISEAPRLERFVLEAPHVRIDSRHKKLFVCACIHKNLFGCACPPSRKLFTKAYFHPKEVKFVGYRGERSQFELIKHFVEKDVALEKIVVDPRYFEVCLHRRWDYIFLHKSGDEIAARARANQLKDYVPARINVKIL